MIRYSGGNPLGPRDDKVEALILEHVLSEVADDEPEAIAVSDLADTLGDVGDVPLGVMWLVRDGLLKEPRPGAVLPTARASRFWVLSGQMS